MNATPLCASNVNIVEDFVAPLDSETRSLQFHQRRLLSELLIIIIIIKVRSVCIELHAENVSAALQKSN